MTLIQKAIERKRRGLPADRIIPATTDLYLLIEEAAALVATCEAQAAQIKDDSAAFDVLKADWERQKAELQAQAERVIT